MLELFVFTGVRGLCTYRIEKKIYTSITRKISPAGLIDTIVKEKEILHVSVPVGCDVSPPPTGMETSTTLLRKPRRSHENMFATFTCTSLAITVTSNSTVV